MKYQPTRAQRGNDDVRTPPELCKLIVEHFKPQGFVMEPCEGDGNFSKELSRTALSVTCLEIKNGWDFFEWELCAELDKKYDWIITNPPWSQVRPFLRHAMTLANNIVFLITVNHAWTRARVRDVREGGFGIHEILLVDTPPNPWPQSGFQLGAIHWQRGYKGPINLTDKTT